MRKLVLMVSVLMAGMAVAAPVAVVPSKSAPISAPATADNTADIARVEAYINGLTTMTADFTQTAADGQISRGKFYLQRPGKMRWQYDTPTPLLLVSDGKVIAYYDQELDQLSYIDLDETLAGFLAQKHVALNSAKTKLTQFTSTNGIIRATLVQKAKPAEGSLTLEFRAQPLALTRIDTVDATGQTTRVMLENPRTGLTFERKLFIFEAPKSARLMR